MLLDDGSEYAHSGVLQFADITVDASTGSIRVRALVPNPERELLPGMFVRARIEEGVNPQAILVPQVAVSRNQRGQPTAMVVSSDGKAEVRVLVTDRAAGDQWVVSSGLNAGDQVIVQNLQRVRPGVSVKTIPATNVSGVGGSPVTSVK